MSLRTRSLLKYAPLCALAVLVACGGGGIDAAPVPDPIPTPNPAPSTDPAAVQGFWSGQVDAQTTASAVILPDGTVWNILLAGGSATAIVRADTTIADGAFTISGRSFSLPAGTTASYTVTGTAVSKSTLAIAPAGGAPAYALAYNVRYETPANLADIAGSWTASFGAGAVKLALDISAAGALAGNSTNGCSYTGSVLPHPAGVAVFNLGLVETCPGTPTRQFAGIATVNGARTALSAAFALSDLSAAGIFQAIR